MHLIHQIWNRLKALPDIGRFLLTGLIATLVHYVILRILLVLSLPLLPANVIGFSFALLVSYSGNRYFVFTAKYDHLKSFTGLALGAIIAAALHTSLLVGLADGIILSFLDGPAHNWGGGIVMVIWEIFLRLIPEAFSNQIVINRPYELTTGFAFIIACAFAALLTYFWNRNIVFQPQKN